MSKAVRATSPNRTVSEAPVVEILAITRCGWAFTIDEAVTVRKIVVEW